MHNNVTYPNLRGILGYTSDRYAHHQCQLMSLGVEVSLLTSWHEYVQQHYEACAYVTQWSTS